MRLPVGLAPVAPTRNSQTFAFGKVRFANYLHFYDIILRIKFTLESKFIRFVHFTDLGN